MSRQLTILLAATVTGLMAPSTSQSDSSGYFFDCDVPAARKSSWHGAVESTSGIEVLGTIQVLNVRHDERWWPVGSIFLRDSDDQQVGLQFYFNWKSPGKLQVALFAGDRKTFASLPMSDLPIPFVLAITASGDLTASVAEESETIRLDAFGARRIVLSCSSGQFKFENVVVDSL